jgi:hypothetical protein
VNVDTGYNFTSEGDILGPILSIEWSQYYGITPTPYPTVSQWVATNAAVDRVSVTGKVSDRFPDDRIKPGQLVSVIRLDGQPDNCGNLIYDQHPCNPEPCSCCTSIAY